MKGLGYDIDELSPFLKNAGVYLPGICTSFLYVGRFGTVFPCHQENDELGALNYMMAGETKKSIVIARASTAKFQELLKELFPRHPHKECSMSAKHVAGIIHEDLLARRGINYTVVSISTPL